MNLKFNNLLIIIVFLTAGCGVKTDPLPPVQFPTPQVTEINQTVKDNNLIIQWKAPSDSQYKETSFDYFNIYRASFSKENFCEKCPLILSKAAEIVKSYYSEKIETDKVYFFQISVVAENGVESTKSKIVKVGF